VSSGTLNRQDQSLQSGENPSTNPRWVSMTHFVRPLLPTQLSCDRVIVMVLRRLYEQEER